MTLNSHTTPIGRTDLNQTAGLLADYIAGEVLEGIDTRGMFSRESRTAGSITVGYGDRPSRAWLRTAEQFVLVKTHAGAISAVDMHVVQELAIQVERLADARRSIAGTQHELILLRGIELHTAEHTTLHIDYLYDEQTGQTLLAMAEIKRTLENYSYHGTLEVRLRPYAIRLGEVAPLEDRFYEPVRMSLHW